MKFVPRFSLHVSSSDDENSASTGLEKMVWSTRHQDSKLIDVCTQAGPGARRSEPALPSAVRRRVRPRRTVLPQQSCATPACVLQAGRCCAVQASGGARAVDTRRSCQDTCLLIDGSYDTTELVVTLEGKAFCKVYTKAILIRQCAVSGLSLLFTFTNVTLVE